MAKRRFAQTMCFFRIVFHSTFETLGLPKEPRTVKKAPKRAPTSLQKTSKEGVHTLFVYAENAPQNDPKSCPKTSLQIVQKIDQQLPQNGPQYLSTQTRFSRPFWGPFKDAVQGGPRWRQDVPRVRKDGTKRA